MSGYIKDYRKELQSDIWLMPPLYHRVWQWIKYSVNHKATRIPFRDGSRVEVGEGERITSLRQIAEGVGYYENGVWKTPHVETIRRILQWLEGEQMISLGRDRRYTHLKVLNWRVYQGDGVGVCDREWTDDRQTTSTNNNDKNDKNDKKKIERISKPANFDYQEIVDLYHESCPSLPRIIKLNSARRTAIKTRYKEHGIDGLKTLFTKAEASNFLSGRNGRWTGCNLDWLLKSSNCLKVLEGNYDNPGHSYSGRGQDEETAAERLLRKEIEKERDEQKVIDIPWAEGG